MDTPAMSPEEVTRVLDAMTSAQKRALKKAGFTWDGLHRLAATSYGSHLAEAVLACHTDLLGRPPRADEGRKPREASPAASVDPERRPTPQELRNRAGQNCAASASAARI
jgi:hypothetical protein